MVDLSFDLKGAKKLQRTPQQIQRVAIPRAESNALERSAKAGREAVIKDLKTNLDEPIPAMLKTGRGGWIWIDFTFRKDLKAGKDGNARVFVNGPVRNRKVQKRAVETIHRHAYGTRETSSPLSVPYIIEPSHKLVREKRLQGVPYFRVDDNGNIRNYRKTMDNVFADPLPRWIHVRLGETFRLSESHTLQPGLYFRHLRKRKYKRHVKTRRRAGPYNGGERQFESIGISTVLQYFRFQDYNKPWDFKANAIEAMRKEFSEAYAEEFVKAIARERRR